MKLGDIEAIERALGPASQAALDEISARVAGLAGADRHAYLCATVSTGVAFMRGALGDQFVREFLTAALADLDVPSMAF